LRIVEDEAARGRGEKILLRAGREAAIYLLNKKRSELAEIEERYGVSVEVAIDEAFEGARMTVESSGPRPVVQQRRPEPALVEEDLDEDVIDDKDLEDEEQEEEQEEAPSETRGGSQEDRPGRRRRRRRRGGRGRRREGGEESEAVTVAEGERPVEDAAGEDMAAEESEQPEAETSVPTGDRKRRGRRGRRNESAADVATTEVEPDSSPMADRPTSEENPIATVDTPAEPEPLEKPKRKRSRAKTAPKAEAEVEAKAVPEPIRAEALPPEAEEKAAPSKPARRSRSKKAVAAEPVSDESVVPSADNDEALGEGGEPRRGWWQRTFG
jgi:ribonuclease E